VDDRARDHTWLVLALAACLTLLNAVKPVTVDDPAYLRQAAWWAAHPGDPLGGETLFYQTMVPARTMATPPVAIGWLALGHRVLGDRPWALKLWLFPFALLLVASLDTLLSRLAPTRRRPLLAMAVLSPSLLPSFNFMLDVPVLALAVTALAVFQSDPARGRHAVAAGVLAGLALQTKFTALPLLPALLALGVFAGRPWAGLVAIGVALGVAGAIEATLLIAAGSSPVVEYVTTRAARDPAGHDPVRTAWRLVLQAGAVAAPLIPLGLAAFESSRRWTLAALAGVLGGYALLALAPARLVSGLDGVTGGRLLNHENLSLGWMGPVVLGLAVLAVWRTFREPPSSSGVLARTLAIWLVAECVLAPFVSASASVRRVLGAVAVLTLLLAPRLERGGASLARAVGMTAIGGVVLGLVFWAVDLDSALAERRALDLARQAGGGRPPMAYVATHWGAFQDAARRAGLRPVSAGRSSLERDQLLLVPFGVEMRDVALSAPHLELVDSVPLPHRLPLTTRRAYYDGRLPLRRTDPRWVGAYRYRVVRGGEVLEAR
jgi:hypothetical protein